MGRASKFSFPFPGRKSSTPTKEKEGKSSRALSQLVSHVPKAQRILGTDNDLNIDSPARDDDRSWDHPSSASSVSGMSISISETTRSAYDAVSVADSHADRWDIESGVFPRYQQQLRAKPSSTLLGRNHGEEPGTDSSSVNRRIRHEESNSTLKSYYDRQKSPLAISQQTSASSARDLALRKGYPPVVRSPLLQVDQVQNIDDHIPDPEPYGQTATANKLKKKNGRLEISTLFPKPRKTADGGHSSPATAPPTTAPYSRPGNQPYPAQGPYSAHEDRRAQPQTRDRWQQQQQLHGDGQPSNQPRGPNKRHTDDTLTDLYDRYEQLDTRMLNIPESGVPNYDKPLRSPLKGYYELDGESGEKKRASHSHSPGEPPFSWKNMRANMVNRPWETSSVASASSRQTKTSRHTSASVLSNSNLKFDSVLSLSSGSEDEASDHEPEKHVAPPISRAISQRNHQSHRQSAQSTLSVQSAGLPHRAGGSKRSSAQVRPSFTIPESHLPSTRISGPWQPPELEDRHSPLSYSSDKSMRKPSKASSRRSSRHSTPPRSPVPPIPAEYRDESSRSSRLMAVTEQEVALLEALRQKKARMREEIIEEHETTKTPPKDSLPKVPQTRLKPQPQSRNSTARSEVLARSTGPVDSKERILLYLNAPVTDRHLIDTAEPSPDLSDFLSFGSDEDSTPRSSWAPTSSGQPRPDSSVSPNTRRGSRKSQRKGPGPITPPNAARLSAVGAISAFPDGRAPEADPKTRLANGAGVQLLDERRLANALLMDEQAGGGTAWAM